MRAPSWGAATLAVTLAGELPSGAAVACGHRAALRAAHGERAEGATRLVPDRVRLDC